MKVLLIENRTALGLALYRALAAEHQVVWMTGVWPNRGLYEHLNDGFVLMDQVNPEDLKARPEVAKVDLKEISVAIVEGHFNMDEDDEEPGESLTGDYEGAEIVEALNYAGIVCIGVSNSRDARARLERTGCVYVTDKEDLLVRRNGVIPEAQRMFEENSNSPGLKALTLRQPFAWSVFFAGKDVENRLWPTPIRGTIAIHAAEVQPDGVFEASAAFIRKVLRRLKKSVRIPAYDDVPRGAIIGLVDIVDCSTKSASPWFEGPIGFTLSNPRLLPHPIPCPSRRRFFKVPVDIEREIERQLTA